MRKKDRNKPPKLGDLVPDIKERVQKLKEQLDSGVEFSKASVEYIEDAYERLENGVPLSVVQVWVLSHIEPKRGD